MAKMVIICSKNNNFPISNEKLRQCFDKITPPNFTPKHPVIKKYNNIMIGIFNPSEGSCYQDDKCAYLGKLFTSTDHYSKVNSEIPDGSFVLFRFNQQYVELVADASAMYTMWYVLTDELFIASSSQRIIISLLQNYEYNYKAWQHFFCRGTLGLGQSWDRRISHLRSRERIVLDQNSWELKKRREELPMQNLQQNSSDDQLIQHFKEDIESVLQKIKIDWQKYRLPLSGGFDSRFLYLFFLHNKQNVQTISWTNIEKLNEKDSDGYLAKQLTEYYKTNHTFCFMDNSCSYSKETILDKFLICSEGRIDHIGTYMDGMKMYERLVADDISGLIRGTQVFGRKNGVDVNRVDVLTPLAFLSPSDYPEYKNLQLLVRQLNQIWGEQEFPEELKQKSNENFFQWGERLWLDYTSHSLFGSLNEIKLTYLDVVHPYMSKKIIESCWKLPDHLRANNKTGFRKIVESVSPPIPFAKAYATPSVDEICQNNFSEILYDELNSLYARNLLSNSLVNFILSGMNKGENLLELKNRALNPSFYRMGFRAYIIMKMNQVISMDVSCPAVKLSYADGL